MNRSNRSRRALFALPLLAAAPFAIAACAGKPIVSPIDGEPVCADYELGAAHTKMTGGLRFPVQITIKTGKTQVFKTILLGRRTEKDVAKHILLADDDETFQVEWAQCENERASAAADAAGRDMKGLAKYECGAATPYKTEDLVTKRGDPKSHTLTFPAPPSAACLQGLAAAAPTPTATATAEAAPSGTATAEAAPSGTATAEAAPSGSPTAAPTATATASATATATASAAPKK